MTSPIRITIAGATGRMGKTLIEAVLNNPACKLAGAFDVAGSPALGRDAGDFMGIQAGVVVTDDVQAALAGADLYLTGELSEPAVHVARECGLTLAGAGHHATERCGVQALGQWIALQHH